MCKRGDIIVVRSYKSQGQTISRHSFVVLDDQNGEVCGLDFDFVCLVMSSFKDEAQRRRKLRYPGNFEITPQDENVWAGANTKSRYIKAEQFYYFKKENLDYRTIGSMSAESFDKLIDFIEQLAEKGITIEQTLDNL